MVSQKGKIFYHLFKIWLVKNNAWAIENTWVTFVCVTK